MILRPPAPWSRCPKPINIHRFYTTEPEPSPSKKYSNTLLLPTTDFPLRSDPTRSIDLFRKRTCDKLYQWQWDNKTRPLFVLHDGPPYANGNLHMGHALNKILKDIITRYRVLRGHRVHYVPGWDCHGLPIENKALEELGIKSSQQLSPEVIREAAEKTAREQIQLQKEQFRQFGIMADWDSEKATYRTLDHEYEMRQLRIFQKMVQNGLIYRNHRPVYYSPSSRSALAESELEYKDDHISHSVYVTFDLCPSSLGETLQDAKLFVWTSTPWTLTANMGIAVNPKMTYTVVKSEDSGTLYIVAAERIQALSKIIGSFTTISSPFEGSRLVGLRYQPLFGNATQSQPSLPLIASSHVTPDSGTGLVHCAPAHGTEDYNLFKAQGLLSTAQDLICHVDSLGNFDQSVLNVVGVEGSAAEYNLIGKDVLDTGSRAIVELLKERGRVVRVQRYKHKYPYDWRTKLPVITTATWQWFANLERVKDRAVEAVSLVKHIPPQAANRLQAFLTSRTEWCISRQRFWGVPILSLHQVGTDTAILDSASLDHILSVLEEKGTNHWWTGPVSDFIPPHLQQEQEEGVEWQKGTDTMDVWFDSGTSWSMLEFPEIHAELELGVKKQREFRADVCLEGSDQHRGWFQSQLLTAIGSALGEEEEGDGNRKSLPYRTLITHGMVLDDKGTKMSKSLGNVVDPMILVNGGKDKKLEPAYGPDLLRLWSATVDFTKDMSIGKNQLLTISETMRRIRNSARFVLGNIGSFEEREREREKGFQPVVWDDMSLLDRYVMEKLAELEKTAIEGYEAYDFAKVMTALNHFTNITLSSLYFDVNKDCLYAQSMESLERRAVVTVLHRILQVMTNVFAPVLPHLAEEIHHHFHGCSISSTNRSFFQTPWTIAQSSNTPNTEVQSGNITSDMEVLLSFRQAVLSVLENARKEKLIRSSLEAEVYIITPDEPLPDSLSVLEREESLLAKLFIVSDACLVDEGSLGTMSPSWLRVVEFELNGCEFAIQLHPAQKSKCPRCWTFTREEGDELCERCQDVIQ